MKAIRIRRASVALHHAKELAIGLALGAVWVAGACVLAWCVGTLLFLC
jgi:hypothetical protein